MNSTKPDAGNFLKSVLFIPYFKENGALQPMLAVGWSLNYEMVFYASAALALVLAPRSASPVSCIILIAIFFCGRSFVSVPAWQAFCGNWIVIEFPIGIGIFYLHRAGYVERVPVLIAVLGLAGTYAAMVYLEITGGWQNRVAAFAPLAAGTVVCAVRLEAWARWIDTAANGLPSAIGDASYTTYLIQYFVVEGVRKVAAPRVPLLDPHSLTGIVFTIALTLCAGQLLFAHLDRPMTRGLRRIRFG